MERGVDGARVAWNAVQKVLNGAVTGDIAAEHPALEARVLWARFDLGENVGQLVTIGDAAHGDEAFLVVLTDKGGTNVQNRFWLPGAMVGGAGSMASAKLLCVCEPQNVSLCGDGWGSEQAQNGHCARLLSSGRVLGWKVCQNT